jgi:hypothetical protein
LCVYLRLYECVPVQVVDYEGVLRGEVQEMINLMRLENADLHLPAIRVRRPPHARAERMRG